MENKTDPVGALRQICFKNQHISFTDEHAKRLAEIISVLKKMEGVSFSNLFKRQTRIKSDEDCLLLLQTKSKNLCVIAIYVKGSNVRLEINCNSTNLKYFKREQLKKIRSDMGLGNGKG